MSAWDLGGIALLGVFHGLNPAMGWLFATAIGLQERSRRALAVALVPIAIGHEASIGLTVLLVQELRVLASDTSIRIGGAVALGGLALWQILRAHRHPRWVGMRLRKRELALWSFVMSSAHGAGLMLLPFLIGVNVHGAHDHIPAGIVVSGAAVMLHVLAMVAVAGLVALLVYEVFGVGILRRAWLNLDRLWAYALGAGAVATLVVA